MRAPFRHSELAHLYKEDTHISTENSAVSLVFAKAATMTGMPTINRLKREKKHTHTHMHPQKIYDETNRNETTRHESQRRKNEQCSEEI